MDLTSHGETVAQLAKRAQVEKVGKAYKRYEEGFEAERAMAQATSIKRTDIDKELGGFIKPFKRVSNLTKDPRGPRHAPGTGPQFQSDQYDDIVFRASPKNYGEEYKMTVVAIDGKGMEETEQQLTNAGRPPKLKLKR